MATPVVKLLTESLELQGLPASGLGCLKYRLLLDFLAKLLGEDTILGFSMNYY